MTWGSLVFSQAFFWGIRRRFAGGTSQDIVPCRSEGFAGGTRLMDGGEILHQLVTSGKRLHSY